MSVDRDDEPKADAPAVPAGPLEAALHAALHADPADPTAVEAARLALLRQWDPMAWHEASKWFRGNASRGDVRDYHGAAVLGMWEAAQKFDPCKGYVFSTYAYWYILKHLKLVAHHEASGGIYVPINQGNTGVSVRPFGQMVTGDGTAPFEGTIPDRESPSQDVPPVADEVWAAVDRIVADPRERLVLRRRFRDGRTLDQVGVELGVSKERVRQIETAALNQLRERDTAFTGFVDL
jgi:RNA polymerase sigma factor (sigma-70 family)